MGYEEVMGWGTKRPGIPRFVGPLEKRVEVLAMPDPQYVLRCQQPDDGVAP